MNFDIPYKDQRVEAAIAFIAAEHKKRTREYLSSTALFKYLAFFDFRSLEESGEPALGLTYIAMKMGPVPKEIYIDKKYWKSSLYRFDEKPFFQNGKEYKAFDIVPLPVKKKDYLDYFSEYDKELLDNLLYFFSQSWVTAKIMSDSSHARNGGIKAWIKTWNKKQNSTIDMAVTFDDLEEKYINKTATASEEHFLIYQHLHA